MAPDRKRRLVLGLIACALVSALLVALVNARVLGRGNAKARASIEELDAAPVAIVLGAGVRRDGTPSHALEDRLAQAVELHRTGKVRKLLLSGDRRERRYDETSSMKRWVLEHGVPPDDVFCDHAGFSTYDTMARAKQVFGITRAIVVTQRFHLGRALYTAEVLGIEAQGAPCDRRTYRKSAWFELRELGSRAKAFAQAELLHSPPRVLGPPISLEGDGRATWGEE